MEGMPLPLPLPPPPTQCYPLYSLYSLYSFYSPHHPHHQTKIQKRNAEKCLLIQKKVLTLRSLKAQVAEW